MPSAAPSALDRARDEISRVAEALLPEGMDIGRGTAGYIAERIPAIAEVEVEDLMLDSCLANSAGLLDALVRGVPLESMQPSAQVVQSTRALVRRGLPWPAVMRAYRVGIVYWCERWADGARRFASDADAALLAAREGTTFLLSWIDVVTECLAEEYRDEASRLAREQSVVRLSEVRSVLGGDDLDVAALSLRLGYDLAGQHLAIVLYTEAAGRTRLADVARSLAATCSAGRPLIVQVDESTTWCWAPSPHAGPRSDETLTSDLVVGCGTSGAGLDGFRLSHLEALEALRTARALPGARSAVTRFADVELAALCSKDPERCRAFVERRLGPLADDDEATRRLRRALVVYLEANSNFRAAAVRLGVHHNTVRHRIAQAERLLQRSVGTDRLLLEMALYLCERLADDPA